MNHLEQGNRAWKITAQMDNIWQSYTQLKTGSLSQKFHVTLIRDSTPCYTYHNLEEKQVTVFHMLY